MSSAPQPIAGGAAHSAVSRDRADALASALGEAARTHSRTLWSVAAAVLGRRDGAEDVVQEAVIVALGKRDELPRVQNMLAWLAQIVRFVALNRRRSARLRLAEGDETLQHVAARGGQPFGSDPAAGDGLVDSRGHLVDGERAFGDDVLHALDSLEETARACLLLRVINELSYREIGNALDIPEGTAMSHVFRARRVMLERLGGAVTQS